jgi:hypothetical protein
MQTISTLENQMRATVHATTAALAIRLRLPQSFREKSRQLVGIWSKKRRSKAPFSI